jgi:F420 biosynthesis protein FbiB-like protein
LHAFLRSRRSVRRFREDPVPDSLIERILTTATYAPSAHNREPWRFMVITSAERKGCLANAMSASFRRDLAAAGLAEPDIAAQVERSERRIHSAPVLIVLCMDRDAVDQYSEEAHAEAERIMAIQSVAAAAAQLLLAAHAEGLGASWICWPLFTPETVKDALELPAGWEPQAMFFMGWPAGDPKSKAVRPLAEVARFERERG